MGDRPTFLPRVERTVRPSWKGSLTFGLVNIPVELHPAVRADDRIAFRQLHAADLSPIHYKRVCEADGEDVPWSEIVKGYEYTKGKFVVLTDDEIKSAGGESAKTIEILDFVRAEEIDPRFFETPYYLLPAKGGEKPYALLREAIRTTGMVGIGKLTMRVNSHHLAGVRVVDQALVLEIMRFGRELVDVGDLTFPPDSAVRPQELKMAEQLIGNLAQPFDPGRYTDEYQDGLRRIINAKLKGKKIEYEEPEAAKGTKVIDLMARLQESLARGKAPAKRKSGRRASGTSKGEAAAPATRRPRTRAKAKRRTA